MPLPKARTTPIAPDLAGATVINPTGKHVQQKATNDDAIVAAIIPITAKIETCPNSGRSLTREEA